MWMPEPSQIFTLAYLQMWERFCYFGARALLLFFLVSVEGLAPGEAYSVYGLFAGIIFLMPFLAGWIVDRFFSKSFAMLVGGVVTACGFFLLGRLPLVGLSCVVVGTAFFRTGSVALAGELYAIDSPARVRGFGWWVLYVNLGAFLGVLLCGYLGDNGRWEIAFSLCGLTILLGLTVLSGRRFLYIPAMMVQLGAVMFGLYWVPFSTPAKVSAALLTFAFHLPVLLGKPVSLLKVHRGRYLPICAFLMVIATYLFFSALMGFKGIEKILLALILPGPIWLLFVSLKSEERTSRPSLFVAWVVTVVLPAGLWVSAKPLFESGSQALSQLLSMILVLLILTGFALLRPRRIVGGMAAILGLGYGVLGLGAICTLVPLSTKAFTLLGLALLGVSELLFQILGLSAVTALAPKDARCTAVGAWTSSFGLLTLAPQYLPELPAVGLAAAALLVGLAIVGLYRARGV